MSFITFNADFCFQTLSSFAFALGGLEPNSSQRCTWNMMLSQRPCIWLPCRATQAQCSDVTLTQSGPVRRQSAALTLSRCTDKDPLCNHVCWPFTDPHTFLWPYCFTSADKVTLNTEQGLLWDMGSMKTDVTICSHFYHRRRSLPAADVVQTSVLFIKSFYEVADVCKALTWWMTRCLNQWKLSQNCKKQITFGSSLPVNSLCTLGDVSTATAGTRACTLMQGNKTLIK